MQFDKYLLGLMAAFSMLLVVLAGDDGKETKKKGLQIGVKKRVDPDKCTIKSRKSDVLHMHYTVSILHFFLCQIFIFLLAF